MILLTRKLEIECISFGNKIQNFIKIKNYFGKKFLAIKFKSKHKTNKSEQ